MDKPIIPIHMKCNENVHICPEKNLSCGAGNYSRLSCCEYYTKILKIKPIWLLQKLIAVCVDLHIQRIRSVQELDLDR